MAARRYCLVVESINSYCNGESHMNQANNNLKKIVFVPALKAALCCVVLVGNAAFAKNATRYNKPASGLVRSAVNYTYVGVQVVSQKVDEFDCSQDGLGVNGSVEINSDFFAIASYTDVDGNRGCGSSTFSVGAGYRALFDADLSMYGAISIEDTSVDFGEDDTGVVLAVGLRTFFIPKLEGKAEVAYHSQYDGNLVLAAGVAYWFHSRFAATGDVTLGTDSNSVAAGIRLNF
jgi:hypothetical protein